jgi:beta-glucosidase-like glycosyl hydrolase
MADQSDLAGDLLRGAKALAKEIYGSDTDEAVRRLYHEKDSWPIFQLSDSGVFYGLRSDIHQHVANKSAEKKAKIAAAEARVAAKAAAEAAEKKVQPSRRGRRRRPHHTTASA